MVEHMRRTRITAGRDIRAGLLVQPPVRQPQLIGYRPRLVTTMPRG
jgi:hypothetical protein